MKKVWFIFLLGLSTSFYDFTPNDQKWGEDLNLLLEEFTHEIIDYDIPPLRLSYVTNLKNIPAPEELEKQAIFFEKYAKRLRTISSKKLDKPQKRDYRHLEYEISLNLARISLSQQFLKKHGKTSINDKGFANIPMGKAWYKYYLKHWLSAELSPEELVDLGYREIKRIQNAMRAIQVKLGYATDSLAFFKKLNETEQYWNNEDSIQKAYQYLDEKVGQNLPKLFNHFDVAPVDFQAIPNVSKDSPPGYYQNNTFYYKFWQNRHKKRFMPLLYIHEAIPGHHYQIQIEQGLRQNQPFRSLFWYSTYAEGWAAYCEGLGKELGVYENLYDEYGALEWNLVRAVRVVLDVGLNYEGWSQQEAWDFWKKHIANQNEIAQREIDRMIRWPAQIHTYVVGATKIRQWKANWQEKLGSNFNIKEFHQQILEAGAMPLEVLTLLMEDQV